MATSMNTPPHPPRDTSESEPFARMAKEARVAEFRIGSVISRSLSFIGRNFGTCFLAMGLLFSPLIIYTVMLVADPSVEGYELWGVAAPLYGLIAQLVAGAILIHAVFHHLCGRRVSFRMSLATGLRRALPALAVTIVYGLAMTIGFILLVVPGVVVACTYWLAVPASVVERPGVLGSMTRSADLTVGNRWSIFGILFVYFGINIGLQRLLEEAFISPEMTLATVNTLLFVSIGMSMVLGALASVMCAVAYHDLRLRHGDIGAEELVSVFD